jgi:hypothetical protein
MESGQVEHIGFSFHDHFQMLRDLLSSWSRWSVCQFHFSYMDIDHDPGISGIRYAAEKGLAIVVSEPLRSGRLARSAPEWSPEVWSKAPQPWSRAEWALRFVWNCPEVASVILDPISIQDLFECLAIVEGIEPEHLTVEEELFLSKLRDSLRSSRRILCTSCRSCMPCPEEIDVPRIFEIHNDAFIYGDVETARRIYRRELHPAERCNGCGYCESHCVKKLPVIEWLDKARRLLGG